MKLEKKNIESQNVAYIKHIGKVEEMSIVMDKLVDWIDKNNIQIVGDPLSIIYTNPSMVNADEMVYDMALPVSEDVKGDEEVKIKTLPSCIVISTIHKGPYSNLHEVYMKIWNYIMENKYEVLGYPYEIYLNNPQEIPSEELLTEIQFPIK